MVKGSHKNPSYLDRMFLIYLKVGYVFFRVKYISIFLANFTDKAKSHKSYLKIQFSVGARTVGVLESWVREIECALLEAFGLWEWQKIAFNAHAEMLHKENKRVVVLAYRCPTRQWLSD